MLASLARSCFRRRRAVLALWIVALVAISVLGSATAGPHSTNYETPGAESDAALALLEERFPERSGDTISVVVQAETRISDPAVRARFEALVADFATTPHVVGAVTPYDPEGADQVSQVDPTIGFAVLQLDIQGSDYPVEDAQVLIDDVADASGDGVTFELTGFAIQNAEFDDGGGTEMIAILAAMVILLIAFGSVLAMGLPILTAVIGLGIGISIISVLANVIEVPEWTPIVSLMIGLGVGIDYALFIVTRYREGLRDGLDPEQATVEAISTAGRAVLFAGTTVVISVLGMLLMGFPFLEGVAIGSAAVVLVTMVGSVTLLPAMLGFVGRNVDKLRVPLVGRELTHHRAGFWFRWSRLIQARPWTFFVAGTGVVVLLALPVFSLRLGFPAEETAPDSRTSRRAYDILVDGFGPGFSAPLLLVAELPEGAAGPTLDELAAAVRSDGGVQVVVPPQVNEAGDTAVMTVFPVTGGTSIETEQLVSRLRAEVIPNAVEGTPVNVLVGGPNASFIDQSSLIRDRLPIFIAVVVSLSFILLMAVFRSVLVALKAAIMNVLSIGAAYGVLVAVAQWGWLKDVFGITATGPIANFIPMMMFAILFGLSMDYEVFLLSRVREEYVKTGENSLAVADGLAATARVITAAAAIMIMVFLSFVLGPELVVKQVGLGLAVAILVDATIIRMVVVPATMELLGKANWWLPGWLDRALPSVGFEGSENGDLDRELEELTAARR